MSELETTNYLPETVSASFVENFNHVLMQIDNFREELVAHGDWLDPGEFSDVVIGKRTVSITK